ncbi:outer membrane protein assembly factor BamA [Spirosoma utsteinense]|uniref:Outer membrane protein assembly factor BamA n=1 Tax=Spirosoma utsteinense TaxID=2585773 RepID=A0ABR6W2R8_9BACT|nr:outer membrane protein assembly factor BamA [Spirosoma utsteinense]MBC3784319.1 outer membrane protein insertion porin family [Spirosoma utsteinense]MBC3790882.1 outer membrane protein insertion porin family [Spirosoma utsteinense]
MKHCIKVILGVAVLLLNLSPGSVLAQVRVGAGRGAEPVATTNDLLNYASPKDYEIAGLTVTGTRYLDPNSLVSLAGLKVGDKIRIPGEAVGSAVRKLMESGLLDNVEMFATSVVDNKVSLMFKVLERPRLYKVSFLGVKKGEQDQLKDKVKLNLGKIVTNTITKNTQMAVRKFFIDKGYLNTKVKITTIPDSARNNATMRVLVDKGQKVKIAKITFEGREEVEESAVRMKMKSTKEMRFGRLFSPSKFVPKKYEEDKQKLVAYYNKLGYRDASIEGDTVINTGDNTINLNIKLNEGRKYYYRNVDFTGNYLYKAERLREVLGVVKGDVYDPEDLEKKLNGNPGQDLSSLYMDDGYLYYNAQPVEKAVDGDSIDLEIRIFEGKQATINRVILNGNTKTSDHVVMRTVRTLPGQKFSKTNLIRTQRELSTLGYFDPEKIGINPVPQSDGTVDIEYTVEEKPSDQIELSGGWGGYVGFVGTLGLTFNNFSARNIGNLSAWRPLPAGDGQRVQLRFQANGSQYQVYSLSFTEPWLGGRKPNALSVSASHTVYQTFYDPLDPTSLYSGLKGRKPTGSYTNTAFTVGLGRQLKVPDDFFSLTNSLSFQRYNLNNLDIFQIGYNNGVSNNFTFNTTLSRNSIDNPQFPRSGSSFTLSGSFTPPYSAFRKVDISSEKPEDKYKFVEYHKWMFDASWFQTVFGKLVLNTRAHMGFLGSYNKRTDIGPFERFVLGGSGLAGQGQFALAQDIIGLRGYDDRSVYTADYDRTSTPQERSRGGVAYNKFVAELRYPVSLNPSATIFVLAFLEAGNNWGSYKQYNPFDLKRSAGFGARIFMPAFGLIGIDYGYGFDKIPGVKDKAAGQFHFTIGQQFR